MPMRRPVPALIALLALFLLTALVWWRVLHRDTGGSAAAICSTQTPVASLPAPDRITVQVLNATKRTGIAGKARNTLISDGFRVPSAAANDKRKVRIRGVAEIRFGPHGKKPAQLLHYYLPGARMVTTKSKSSTVVLSLGNKYRGIASPSTVQAALTRKQIKLATTAPEQPAPSPSC